MLLKIDRTSMANSLEIRSPFVDHKLVEYVLSHSTPFINSNRPKKILTDYLSSDFETKFLYRKKQGFVFDYKNWIFNNYSDIFDIISSTEVFDLYNIGKVKNFKYLKTRINSLRVWRLFVISNYLLNLNSRSQNT
jgi:asparagine synthase (glutamine-hydrolysing)